MPDVEPDIAAWLHRRAKSLPVDDEVRDRLVRRVRVRQRRRRAVLVGSSAVAALAALGAGLIVLYPAHPSRPPAHAAPAAHGPLRARVSPHTPPSSPPSTSPAPPPGGGGALRWVDAVSPTHGWAFVVLRGRARAAQAGDGD